MTPRTALFACLIGAACLGGHRASAEDGPAGGQPPVVDAAAEVDAEVNTWLTRAAAAMRAGAPDSALPLLLHIARSEPDTMASTNGVTFLPARKLAFDLIRALPERTLAAYRLLANASPRTLADRAAAPTDLATLEESYRNCLPGAALAETGLRLAGLYLDQQRFRDARRVLQDVLKDGSTGRLPRSELLARLLVACARVGDITQAEWAWAELQKEGHSTRWSSLRAELPPATTAAPASNVWAMAYARPSREAAPAGPCPDLAAASDWVIRWGANVDPGIVGGGSDAAAPTNPPPPFSLSRSYAAAAMMDRNRRPADDVIFAGNRAWVNGLDALVAIDLDSGRVVQRAAYRAEAPQPNAARIIINGMNMGIMLRLSRGTSETADGWVFGSRLNRAESLIGGRVFCVEDNTRASLDRNARGQQVTVNQDGVTFTPPCGNALTAYDADTGRLLWRIGRETVPQEPAKAPRRWHANAIRFAAAPVPCAGLLLAPVEDDAGLCVVAVNPDSGTAAWQTRLSHGAPSAAPRPAPLTITVDGAGAYLCGGSGSISGLDGCDGSVLWTTLYEPYVPPSATNADGLETESNATWEESLVLVAGETVVALPEDSQDILALDRRNGTRLWTGRKPEGADYVVGRRDAALIVAGGHAVACVDLTDGRELWRTPIEGSTGRGALCGREVLIPRGRTILRLRAEDGATAGVLRAQTMDGLPLGNLYVNGDQLLVAGPERLYALVDARPTLARLGERLARNPSADGYAERGRLYATMEHYADAVKDLREAWRLQRGSAGEESAHRPLLTALWRAAEQEAGAAENFHSEAREIAVSPAERAEATWRQAQYRERSGNTNGALALYATLVADPGALIDPALDGSNWEAATRPLADQRIRALLAGDPAREQALLGEPAAQALARLGPAAAWTALVEVATVFAGTVAGKEAALRAAQLAAGRGDLGTAEVVLQRALALAWPSDRAAVAAELARVYERMNWPQGMVRLREDWSRMYPGTRLPEDLERAATKAVAWRSANATALPPWRLRWRKKLAANSVVQIVPAGLFHWNDEAKQAGCLALETGLPRWQREVAIAIAPDNRTRWDDTQIVRVSAGNGGAFLDLWSGAIATNALPRIDPANEYPTLSAMGLATMSSQAGGGILTCADALTGQIVWRRRELEPLLGTGVRPVPYSSSAMGVFLMRCEPDGAGSVVALNSWTGEIAFRRTVIAGGRTLGRMAAQGGIWGLAFPHAPELEAPAIIDKRLTVRDRRTGASIWTTPPDMAIVKEMPLPSGLVLAETAEKELLLFGSGNGRILCRSQGVRFSYDYAMQGMGSDAVIASHGVGNGTNEVLVLDPVTGRIAFQGLLSSFTSPLISFAPALPDQLLVNGPLPAAKDAPYFYRRWTFVINAQGENSNGWHLPATEEIGDPARSFNYSTVFAEGLILLFDQASGEVLAYEHDPGD